MEIKEQKRHEELKLRSIHSRVEMIVVQNISSTYLLSRQV